MTKLEPLQQVDRTCVRFRGRKLLYFSGCDYFRLASHPGVLKAAVDGLKKFGLNVAASRLTTGHHEIYEKLEQQLAKFFAAEDALLVASGYLTSAIAAQALAGNFSHALVDERAHPALLDAAVQLNCPILKFKHRDAEDFARAVGQVGQASCLSGRAGSPSHKLIVLTDGMFSHDGSVAPLKKYLKLLPRNGLILLDDAHGAGVLGKNGRGTPEFENVSRRRIVQCVTLSKAFGVYGGAILGTRELREKIFARSRMFTGSTPPPLPLANAALHSVKILGADKSFRQRLNCNAEFVKAALRKSGVKFPETPGPIVRLQIETESEITALKRELLAAGIYPPFLKYHGAANGYFRFVIFSEHTRAQLNILLAVLTAAGWLKSA
jgi:7-keto-8-aminopelargonate synthetase-like enzyme